MTRKLNGIIIINILSLPHAYYWNNNCYTDCYTSKNLVYYYCYLFLRDEIIYCDYIIHFIAYPFIDSWFSLSHKVITHILYSQNYNTLSMFDE